MSPSPSDDNVSPRRRYAPRMAPAQRREQLLDAALAVIVGHGYEGVSVEAVARAAGVTRPVIYDHFPNLGSLLRALIEREEALALAQLARVVPEDPPEGDPPNQLAAGVRRFLDGVASRPNTWRIILLPPEGTPAIVRQHVETNRAALLDRLQQFVAAAARAGDIPPELDLEICARVILRLSEEAGRMVLTDGQNFSPERYERFTLTLTELIWRRR